MNIFIYDGSIVGLLSCIFFSYSNKIKPDFIYTDAVQYTMCDITYDIASDEIKAERVERKLKTICGNGIIKTLTDALRYKDETKHKIVFDYVCEIIDTNSSLRENFINAKSRDFIFMLDKIYFEVHRFTGFIRFMETVEGFFYAPFEPDNDIVDLLFPHFAARYGDIPFVLHDVKRNKMSMSNGKERKTVNCDSPVTIYLSENETNFVDLWKAYYKSVNIVSRKNLRQMRNYMPTRYNKYAPEKHETNLVF